MIKDIFMFSPLKRDLSKSYGTRAQPIYDEGCNMFGWDKNKRSKFAQQQLLYATNATKERFSVWFLCNSNLNGQQNGNWKNEIYDNYIEETWGEKNYDLENDRTIRVTFAKTKSNGYVFIGLYKPYKTEQVKLLKPVYIKGILKTTVWIKYYERISDNYPIQ